MKSLAEGWSVYAEHILSVNATAAEKAKVKRIYYSGACQTLRTIMLNILSISGENAAVMLARMEMEGEIFTQQVRDGEA